MAANPNLPPSAPPDLSYTDQTHSTDEEIQRSDQIRSSYNDLDFSGQEFASSPSSNNTTPGSQTWQEFLRDTNAPGNGESSSRAALDSRRSSLMALDRKRRMTGSTDESARRRAASGGIYRHGYDRDAGISSPYAQSSRAGQPGEHWLDRSGEGALSTADATNASNRPFPRRTSSNGRRSSGVREYARPRWQPDSEVGQCPICGNQFTFWYRKHHCRKCGRVVCASCSPHRITIPRQFIVQPPNNNTISESSPIDASSGTVNLPEANLGRQRAVTDPSQRHDEHSNPALGGGEEVRLCNPCVPDPNPNPPQAYRFPSPFSRQDSAYNSHPLPPIPGAYRPTSFTERPSTRNPNAWNPSQATAPTPNMSAFIRSGQNRRQGPPGTQPGLEESGYSPDEISSVIPGNGHYHSRMTGYDPRNVAIPGSSAPSYYPSQYGPRSHLPFHRGQQSESSSGNHRNRLSYTYIDDDASPSPYHPHSGPPRHHRPRIPEEDMCPICRHELPPKGPDGFETAREAHVQSCIDRAINTPTPSSTPQPPGSNPNPAPSTQPQHQRQPSRPLAYASHTATEKDCVAEDGSERECTICLVEFEVGDELAVLECLCKFHKVCIRAWLDKAGSGCPLHKIWDLEAGLE